MNEGLSTDNMIRPFVRTRLDEEKKEEKRTTLNISWNPEEWTRVKQAQDILNVPQEGTAVKMVFEVGLNVLRTTLGYENLKFLASSKRKRLYE